MCEFQVLPVYSEGFQGVMLPVGRVGTGYRL